MFTRGIFHELLWFLKGGTNIEYLVDNNVHIWDAWADGDGNLGPIYGKQWRSWEGKDGKFIDQISHVVEEIKANPSSRRLVVSAWNVGELDEMALLPCHMFFQFYVVNNTLSCQFYMRSSDTPVGLPFNIASYALLTHMIAQQCGLDVGELIFVGGDCHIYKNQLEGVKQQLEREPYSFPRLELRHRPSIDEYTIDDIQIVNYVSHAPIRFPVAV